MVVNLLHSKFSTAGFFLFSFFPKEKPAKWPTSVSFGGMVGGCPSLVVRKGATENFCFDPTLSKI